jgi:hypothetical protein
MFKKTKFSRIAIAVAMSVGLSSAVMAQSTTSSIRGNVATEAGTIFSGANVTITHVPSGTVSTATTNASGVFSARGLRVGGPYSVKISGGEFAPVQYDDLYLSLDQAFSLPVTVEETNNTEVIQITGSNSAVAGFSNDGLSTNLGIEALGEVTSIDRDITDAAALNPFASVDFSSDGDH